MSLGQPVARSCEAVAWSVLYNTPVTSNPLTYLPLLLSYPTDRMCAKHPRLLYQDTSANTLRAESKLGQPPALPACVASSCEPDMPVEER